VIVSVDGGDHQGCFAYHGSLTEAEAEEQLFHLLAKHLVVRFYEGGKGLAGLQWFFDRR
jgi:hypothetical protein